MSADEPRVDAIEIAAPTPIDTAERRLEAWSVAAAIGGSTNVVRVGGVLYTWDVHPRRQKNGAVIGRVYAKRRGELMHDAGMYKIDAGGRVLQIPAELRAVMPGALEAEIAPADPDREAAP